MDCFFGEKQQFFAAPFYSHHLSDTLALRIYPDNQPHNLKIAPLQKGLILSYHSVEIVGEGAGFGVPVIKYRDRTYYSADATVKTHQSSNQVTIQKTYYLNTISRSQIGSLSLQNNSLSNGIEALNRIYQNNKQIAALVLKSKPLICPFVTNSKFVAAPLRGKVTATYKIQANRIRVDMDFGDVEPENLQQIIVLNEQGAQFFRDYRDCNGVSLRDGAIGVWNLVDADYACISAPKIGLSFGLKQIQGTKLRRGREVADDYLDWAGLDYELQPHTNRFSYDITLSGGNT